jgi:co-chaperonin GroES (HSP10)
MKILAAGRTGRGAADSGRGNHAASEVASRCLPKAEQAPEAHSSIEPLHDRVLVERLPQVTETKGILIPEVGRKIAILCKVIAVGPGRWEDGVFTTTAVKPGDVVLVPGCGNTHPDWREGQQILIQQADIGAIVG